MAGFYVEIVLPGGEVAEYAKLSSFEEAIIWLDARNPAFHGRIGRLLGVVTNEQIKILREKGYGPG